MSTPNGDTSVQDFWEHFYRGPRPRGPNAGTRGHDPVGAPRPRRLVPGRELRPRLRLLPALAVGAAPRPDPALRASAVAPGGSLLVIGNARGHSWRTEAADVEFPTLEEVLEDLALPPSGWAVRRSDVVTRESRGPDGRTERARTTSCASSGSPTEASGCLADGGREAESIHS